MTAASCGLIIFIRYPEKGKVKTRLASSIGEEEALKIYQFLVHQTIFLATQMTIPVYFFYEGGLPDISERQEGFAYFLQNGNSLGEKMQNAFQIVLASFPKAIIIGSDCPELTTQDMYHAMELLDESDVVLGPAVDGGYYLLGCKEVFPGLFSDIAWGTSTVAQQTIQKIKAIHRSYQLLRVLGDIDTKEDWENYNRLPPKSPEGDPDY